MNRLLVVLVVALPLLAGCGYHTYESTGYVYTEYPQPRTYTQTLVAKVHGAAGALAWCGDDVELELSVENENSLYDYYRFSQGYAVRFSIIDGWGHTIWHSDLHEDPLVGSYRLTLVPWGTMSVDSWWDLTDDDGYEVAPGRYYLYADHLGHLDSGTWLPNMGPEPIDVACPNG